MTIADRVGSIIAEAGGAPPPTAAAGEVSSFVVYPNGRMVVTLADGGAYRVAASGDLPGDLRIEHAMLAEQMRELLRPLVAGEVIRLGVVYAARRVSIDAEQSTVIFVEAGR